MALLLAALSAYPTIRLSAQSSPRDSAWHVLNRLAFGPRPGEVDRVAADGVMRWIDRQLHPATIDDSALAARERDFTILRYDRAALARVYRAAQEERRARLRDGDAAQVERAPGPKMRAARQLAAQFADLAVVRATLSERQLYEVMVDFWTNHFNVFFGKGADRFLLPDYVEHVIRPHAMGRFEDLLIATAHSPAMLFYLDNWESAAPPRNGERGSRNGMFRARRLFTGLNENYARELLELHTLGVDAGYTQQDVINVARIFTGWSIEAPRRGGGFAFRAWAHDRGAKVVMGVTYPAGHGMDEGIRLLKWLATEPATMRHVSRELCERFVSDDPPDGCVDDAVAAWRRSGGDIPEVLRAIFRGSDFWARANRAAKGKTPLEFVVSALRAIGAEPDSTPRLAMVVARLGEPLYLHAAPDGYHDDAATWLNSGALLDRMNAGVALAAGRLPGAVVTLDALLPATRDTAALVGAVDAAICGGTMSANTRRVIAREVSGVHDPARVRALAVGLALGGPEFQRR